LERRKTKKSPSPKDDKNIQNIRNNINGRVALAITWVKALYNDPFWGTFPFATKGVF
jgi:hypothetical protein